MLVEQDDMVALLQLAKNLLALLLFLLVGGKALGVFQFGDYGDVKADIVLHTGGIVVYQFGQVFVDRAANQ